MACVDLPAFPLQLLLRQHPDWRTHPAAVVDQDRPQGEILWVNEQARSLRILPGMRYAAALSLAGALRAAVVPRERIDRALDELSERLRTRTPHVERAGDEPGVFWLDARGLERLYDSLRQWAGAIRTDLRQAGFAAGVVVGFSRFGTYALAKSKRGAVVLQTPHEERAAMRRVPLERLALEPVAAERLEKLGITTVGRFLDLPSSGVRRRFGARLHRLHRLARGELLLPLQPEHPESPATQRLLLDHPETDVGRLLTAIERLLHRLVRSVADKARTLNEVQIGFRFERMGEHVESVRPAAPTRNVGQLLELIRLRLQAVRRLPDGVVELLLLAGETELAPAQQELTAERRRRDRAAGNRALARVRAALGEQAVVRAELRTGHLPEGRFDWRSLAALESAGPRAGDRGHLVRRIHVRPIPLAPRPRHEPDGWMLRGLRQGPVMRVLGPYVISGGWWSRAVHRDYHFAETKQGELLWVYYDRNRRRWFLQGRVE